MQTSDSVSVCAYVYCNAETSCLSAYQRKGQPNTNDVSLGVSLFPQNSASMHIHIHTCHPTVYNAATSQNRNEKMRLLLWAYRLGKTPRNRETIDIATISWPLQRANKAQNSTILTRAGILAVRQIRLSADDATSFVMLNST